MIQSGRLTGKQNNSMNFSIFMSQTEHITDFTLVIHLRRGRNTGECVVATVVDETLRRIEDNNQVNWI